MPEDIQIPEFIAPKTIKDMTDEEYEAILAGIRERRMVLVAIHTQTVALKNKIRGEKLNAKADKIVAWIEKDIAKVEKIEESIQLRMNQLRSLKIEALDLEDIE